MNWQRTSMLALMLAEALRRLVREDYLGAALMLALLVFWRAYTTETAVDPQE